MTRTDDKGSIPGVGNDYNKPSEPASALQSSFARRESESKIGVSSAAGAGRERISTGRVENLRSMGSELMRPSSREGRVTAKNTFSAMGGQDSKDALVGAQQP